MSYKFESVEKRIQRKEVNKIWCDFTFDLFLISMLFYIFEVGITIQVIY